MRTFALLALSSFTLLGACGGAAPSTSPVQAAPLAPPGESPAAQPSAPSGGVDAHALLVTTAACWFGGAWGDAMGETPDTRKAGSEARCNEAVRQIYGAEDKAHYEKLRALDVTAVDDVASKMGASEVDVKILRALADAQREALEARRAADRVKKDMTGQREPEKLSTDEVTAVAPLKATKALEALLKLDANDFTHDAHALGMLVAMDRIETSRGLPKHLKVYALEGTFALLFGTPTPNVPEDATKRLDRGAYLAYVTDAAKSAGHPVPDSVTAPKEREPLAWSSTIDGVLEKMSADVDHVKSKTLNDVITRVAHRLGAETTAKKSAPSAPPSPATAPAPAPKK